MLRRYIQPAVAQPNHKNMHLSLSSSFRSSPFSSGEASLYPDAEKILLDHYGDSTRRNIRKWCCRKFIRIDTRRRSTYSGVYLPDKTYVRYTYIWIGSWLNPAQERFVTRKKKKKKRNVAQGTGDSVTAMKMFKLCPRLRLQILGHVWSSQL